MGTLSASVMQFVILEFNCVIVQNELANCKSSMCLYKFHKLLDDWYTDLKE